jgi:hypothetical protein
VHPSASRVEAHQWRQAWNTNRSAASPAALSAGRRHDLEAAANAATTTAQLAATVHSSRSTQAVHDLRQRLQGHDDSPAVGDFLALAETLFPMSS